MSRVIAKTISVIFLASLSVLVSPVHAFEWKNLWSSPEQRAAKQLENERYDELSEQAPNAQWRGLGEYRKGDYESAIESFAEQRENAEAAGQVQERDRASYNQANAHMQNSQYQEAINLYDELLSANPEHENASHNRGIAQQLLEQQQQDDEGGSDDSDDKESSEDGEQQDQESSDQSEEGDSQDQQNEQQTDEQDAESSDNAESQDSGEGEVEQQKEEEAAQAEQAMQAEQQRETDEQMQGEEVEAVDGEDEQAAPLTEREQANEQWLRQIPDDPAGLLERKIQNRHVTDFPKVQDSDKPW